MRALMDGIIDGFVAGALLALLMSLSGCGESSSPSSVSFTPNTGDLFALAEEQVHPRWYKACVEDNMAIADLWLENCGPEDSVCLGYHELVRLELEREWNQAVLGAENRIASCEADWRSGFVGADFCLTQYSDALESSLFDCNTALLTLP